jgi:excisionase family DNA binding protein
MSHGKSKLAKQLKPNSAEKRRGPGAASDSEQRTMRVEDAAKVLGISRAGAYRCARNGVLPAIRIGGRVLVLKAAFEKLLANA